MSRFNIKGKTPLSGTIEVSGNKNSALKQIVASLLTDEQTILTNVPRINDFLVMEEIVDKLGAKVHREADNKVTVDPKKLNTHIIEKELSGKVRTAPLLMAPLLLRFGKAQIFTEGGCSIGLRLLSTHFNMLEEMGAKIKSGNGGHLITFNPKPEKREIFLEEASVTATELGLMIASGIPSETVIYDAACEPHIEDLAELLIKMGADIKGAGTNTLYIKGVKNLKGVTHSVQPDHIEAGSWAIAAAVTGGRMTIKNAPQKALRMTSLYLNHLGLKHDFSDENTWEIYPSDLKFDGKIKEFQTRPWPGFPTDLMSPLIVMATQSEGVMLYHDWMYESRMFFVDDLVKMGAKIIIADPHRVVVTGPRKLRGNNMISKDIRAGISVVIAALAAEGESVIEKIEIIERGYHGLLEKLLKLDAKVERID